MPQINTNTSERTLTITLNKREAELLVALVGYSSVSDLYRTINLNRSIRASQNEVAELLGVDTYRALKKAVQEDILPNVIKVVEFVYDKRDGEGGKWRTLHVTGENSSYIEGLENNETFKRFLKSRIVGGKVITVG